MPSFHIAKRFLTNNKSQTLFIILGIAIGVSVQVFVGSLIQGLQSDLVYETVGKSPQITITHQNKTELIDGWETIISEVEKVEGVTKIAAVKDILVAIIPEGTPITVLLRGFQLDKADKIYNIYESIYAGVKPASANEIIIGKQLQEELEIELNAQINISNPLNQYFLLKVVGFFDLGVATINSQWLITNFETTENVLDYGGKVSSIGIQVADPFDADLIADEIEAKLDNTNLNIVDWKEQNADLLSALSAQGSSSYMIQVFVIISVVLAIASVLAITVLQKSKQLGILKAMGINDRKAANIFLWEGFILGLIGGKIGRAHV